MLLCFFCRTCFVFCVVMQCDGDCMSRVVADEPVLIPRLEQANKLWSLRYSHCIAKDPASSQYWMEKFKDSDDGLLQHQDFVYKALDAFVVDGVLLPALMESPISKHAHLKHKHQPQT